MLPQFVGAQIIIAPYGKLSMFNKYIRLYTAVLALKHFSVSYDAFVCKLRYFSVLVQCRVPIFRSSVIRGRFRLLYSSQYTSTVQRDIGTI
jgi:hypothetical protein